MRSVLLISVMLWLSLFAVFGQGELDVELVKGLDNNGNEVWKAEWPSTSGRTYFMMLSGNMVDWDYCDWVELGTGSVMDQELLCSSTTDRVFMKLRWTDKDPDDPDTGPIETVLTGDADGDDLTNEYELSVSLTDPLSWDTDGDGLSDKWEDDNGTDPKDDGSIDPANGPDGEHTTAGGDTYPNIVAMQFSNVDTDGDGLGDGYDAHPTNEAISWSRVAYHRYEVEEIGQSSSVGDPIDVNDRGDVLFPRHVWTRGQGAPTALSAPGNATYLFLELNDDGEETLEEETIAVDDDDTDTFPDDKIWAAASINNAGAVVGNAQYDIGTLGSSDTGIMYRGLFWPSGSGSPSVTNPKEPFYESSTFFYDLTHNFRILGVDTQVYQNENTEVDIPPQRQDLVTWAQGSRPTRLAKFGLGETLSFDPPMGVSSDFDPIAGGDHRGLIHFGGHAFDSRSRQLITPSGFHNDVARVGDDIVFVGNSGGVVGSSSLISELSGRRVSAAGQVLGPDGETLWMNGSTELLEAWVEPNVTLREYRWIEGFAISDTGVIAAKGQKDGSSYYLLLKPVLAEQPVQASGEDATGPRYRKIALNGLPLPDEAPESTAETDSSKEQTYIDAFNRGLVHQVSDIYIPVGGSDLVLQVTRNYREEIWNRRHGLRPVEHITRPFGAGWSSNICAYIEFVDRDPSPTSGNLEPVTVTVFDEEGRAQRFGSYYGNRYFPMPSGRVEKKTYLNTLTLDETTGDYIYKKKFGNTLRYEMAGSHSGSPFDIDREDNNGGDQHYAYARLKTVTDRYGNTLHYDYGSSTGSLIPSRIYAGQGRDLEVTISKFGPRVLSVTDPRGKVTSYSYKNPPAGNSSTITALWKVVPPGFTTSAPATIYDYSYATEGDNHPRASNGKAVLPRHLRLASITDANSHVYQFGYVFDTTVKAYHTDASGDQYQQTGLPSLVNQVTLPGNRFTSLGYQGETGFTAPSSGAVATKLELNGPHASNVTASKMTWVRDAEGHDRWYRFGEIDVINLSKLPGNKRPDEDDSSSQLIISYEVMEIETDGVGTESYHFDPNAGYALMQKTDVSGNVTTYAYDSEWTTADPSFRYILNNDRFGYFDDPTAEIDALGQVKRYEYASAAKYRMMERITHVDGSVTEFSIDSLGRRTDEYIKENNGGSLTTIQHTHFDYDTTFPAFMITRTMNDLNLSGEPSWVANRITRYEPYTVAGDAANAGRVWKEKVETGTETLTTTYAYDDYGNRTSVEDPRGNTTTFSYDDRNRLETITYPDDGLDPPGVPTKEFRYDKNSNKIGEKDERNIWTVFVYDELNRLEAEGRDMNGNADSTGTLTLEARGTDIRTDYTYNEVNSVETIEDPRGNITTHAYDSAQRRTSTIVPLEGTETATTLFFYENRYDSASRDDGLSDSFTVSRSPGASIFNREGWKPTRIVDPRGYETLVAYDGLYREVHRKARYSLEPTTYQGYTLELEDVATVGNLTQTGQSLAIVAFVNDILHLRVFDSQGNMVVDVSEATLPPGDDIVDLRADLDEYFFNGEPPLDPEEEDAFTRQAFDISGHHYQTYAETWTTYADTARTVTSTDALGKVGEQESDALGRMVKTTVAKGSTTDEAITQNDYTSTGLLWRTTDAEDRETEFEYDGAGRQTKVVQPDFMASTAAARKKRGTNSPVTVTAYDPNGNVSSVTDPENNETLYLHDKRNRRTAEIGAQVKDAVSGNNYLPATLTEYDDAGNVTRVIDRRGLNVNTFGTVTVTPAGNAADYATVTTYDEANRPETVLSPSVQVYGEGATASTTTTAYDDNGNVIEVTDGENNITLNTYDLANRLKTTTTNPTVNQPDPTSTLDDATNIVVTNVYDKVNNLIQVTDGEGQVTSFSFDGLNRRIETAFDPNDTRKERTKFIYNAVNLVERQVLSNSYAVLESTSYAYDDQHRLKMVTYAGSTNDNRHYAYDKVGNILSVIVGPTSTSPDLVRSAYYTYDTLNRIKTETSANVTHTVTSYDKVGNRLIVDYGGTNGRTLTSEYDNLNRLEKCTEGNLTTGRIAEFGYDRVGNLHERVYPNDIKEVRSHDARNRLTSILVTKIVGEGDCAIYTQEYDHVGNVRWIDEEHPGSSTPDRVLTLTYDHLYRLKTEVITRNSGTQTTQYGYDDANNRTSKTVTTTGAVPTGLEVGTWTYTYGTTGNGRNSNQLYQVTKGSATTTLTYDAKGNLVSRDDGTHDITYAFDHENRLINANLPSGYTLPSGSTLSAAADYDFGYDYRTRRVSKSENGTNTTTSFSGGLSVQEYSGLQAPDPTTDSADAHYIRASDFGGGVGGVLFSLRGSGLTSSYYHYNSRGDVTTKTNEAGSNTAATWQTAYGAYGDHLAGDTHGAGTNDDPQRANTKDETGDLLLLNELHRYRAIDLGIFIQRDPAGFVDGPNVYTYVRQNPWTMYDPYGLWGWGDSNGAFLDATWNFTGGLITGTASGLWEGAKGTAVAVAQAPSNIVETAKNIKEIADIASHDASAVWEGTKETAGGIKDGAVQAAKLAGDTIVNGTAEQKGNMAGGVLAAVIARKGPAGMGKPSPGKVYDVGLAKDLRNKPVKGTEVNHTPGSAQASTLVATHKKTNNYGHEPAIRLPASEHGAVTKAQAALPAQASARDLLAKEVRILRKHTNAPNSKIREVIRSNKEVHPWDYKKLEQGGD